MDGSALVFILLPIVSISLIAGWIGMLFYVDAHPGARLKARPRRSQPGTPRRIHGRLRCQALCLPNRPAGRESSPFPCPGLPIAARLRTPPGSAGLHPFPETHSALPHNSPAFSCDRSARDHRSAGHESSRLEVKRRGHGRDHSRDLLTVPAPGRPSRDLDPARAGVAQSLSLWVPRGDQQCPRR